MAHVLISLRAGLGVGFLLMTMLVLFTLVLRRRPVAIAALWLAYFGVFSLASTDPRLLAGFAVGATAYIAATARVGLLAACAAHFAFSAIHFGAIPDAIAWYTPAALFAPLFVLAVAIWAFTTSLGGQRAFSTALLDDQV